MWLSVFWPIDWPPTYYLPVIDVTATKYYIQNREKPHPVTTPPQKLMINQKENKIKMANNFKLRSRFLWISEYRKIIYGRVVIT